MSTVYGGWVATDDFRAKLVYSTSSTNTATTVSATLYIESNAGWSNYGSGSLTIKNGSTTIGSASGSNKAFSAGSTVQVCSKSVTVNRDKSAHTITISCSVGASYTSSTSSKSVTITVSAKPSYTVTYNNNNGTGSPGNQTKWYGESLTLSSTKPTRTGYTFSKWNTKADGSGTSYASGGTYTGNAALTLYAIWTANKYTISYNGNNSTSGSTSSQTKTYNVALTLRTNGFTRTGYTFSKWNTKADGTGTNYNAGGSYTANAATTLYAIWTINTYTVTYNGNGGSGVPSNQTKTYGTSLPLSATRPTRTGYTFSKWNIKADGTGTNYNPSDPYTTNAAVTLYAIWTINTYTVTYNGNVDSEHSSELSGSTANQTKTYDSTLTLQNNGYSRTGYTFLYWNTASDGSGTRYDAGSEYTNNSAVTLYAIWRADAPNVTIAESYRADSTGQPDDEGTYFACKISWSQTLNEQVNINVNVGSGQGTYSTTATEGTYPLSGSTTLIVNAQLATDQSYTATITVSNSHGSTIKTVNLGTAYYPIDAKVGGTGIAFGKAATQEGILDSAFPMKVTVKENDVGITIKHPAILLSNAEPPAENNKETVLIDCLDSNNVSRNKLEVIDCTDGRQGIRLKTKRTINDTDIENALYLSVDAEGNQKVNVTNSPAFRDGIGASNGVWPISMGGTGLSSSPSVLTNLGSTTAANILAASPRPGITGTLGTANGGTGNTNGTVAKLTTARSLYVNLESSYSSSSPVTFDGSANKALPVTGELPISKGGTGKTTAADARTALGAAHNTWTQLATSSNDTAMTYSLTDYHEVMFAARAGTSYVGSVVLPKAHLSTTSREIYLSGGSNNANGGGRGFALDATNTKATPAARKVDGTATACNWWVYAR